MPSGSFPLTENCGNTVNLASKMKTKTTGINYTARQQICFSFKLEPISSVVPFPRDSSTPPANYTCQSTPCRT